MHPRRWIQGLAVAAMLMALPLSAKAEVKTNPLFSDGLVLQQKATVPIWGTADGEEEVVVHFTAQIKNEITEQKATTRAVKGKWRVELKNLPAGGPFQMTIKGAKNTIELKNVYVGEVWICSGQSNMEMGLGGCKDAEKHIKESANPNLRLFTVGKSPAAEPQAEVKGSWVECSPKTVSGFSGVAYFFGRDLQKALGVPVGLIHTSWGGTRAEAWTRREILEANPDLKGVVDDLDKAVKPYQEQFKKFQADLEEHRKAVEKAKEEGKDPPLAPKPPRNPATDANAPSALYNGMIAPLIPYAIQGVIWYQGESNAGKAFNYRTLFPAMIKNWRTDWKQGDFTFLFVQLAPFMAIVNEPQESAWAELREAQLMTSLTVPKTGMAVITDAGDPKDIHPKHKEPAGVRLALAARGIAYGEKIVHSGPLFNEMKINGDKATLTFKHVGGGLVKEGDKLTGFTICGEDKKWVNADATIEGDTIIVSSPKVEKPIAVRYGWANCPVVNFFNKEGIPATPFRTDDFPITTGPKKPAGGR